MGHEPPPELLQFHDLAASLANGPRVLKGGWYKLTNEKRAFFGAGVPRTGRCCDDA